MARPIFNHELLDPDFSWLLSTYKENHPECVAVEVIGLPVVLFRLSDHEYHRSMLPFIAEDARDTSSDKAKE